MPVLSDLRPVLRPVLPGDEAFLRDLFESSRSADFALLPGTTRSTLIGMQFRAQAEQYRADYPQTQHAIITVDGASVGQIRTARRQGAILLVDISVLDTRRGRGIGSAVISSLITQADASRLPVHLSVWALNTPARRLYARLGFLEIAAEAGFASMHRPSPSETPTLAPEG
jgi:ribosomal protein S18 acetylase RimI-like enzyme